MSKEIIIIIFTSCLLTSLITAYFMKCSYKRKSQGIQQGLIKRPELKIIGYRDCLTNPKFFGAPGDMDVYVAPLKKVTFSEDKYFAHYKNECFDIKNRGFVEYTLKNVGSVDIRQISLVSNFKQTSCLFDVRNSLSDMHNGLLNYSEVLDCHVSSDDTIIVKIYYTNNMILSGMFSASLSLQLEDNNGCYWEQALFAPSNKLYESHMISYEEFKDNIKVSDDIIKCFKNPMLW